MSKGYTSTTAPEADPDGPCGRTLAAVLHELEGRAEGLVAGLEHALDLVHGPRPQEGGPPGPGRASTVTPLLARAGSALCLQRVAERRLQELLTALGKAEA